MIPRKSGQIINVASIAGLGGNSADMTMVAYNTSKARGGEFHPHAGRRMGQVQHQRQCPGARLVPEQDDQGHDRAHGRRGSSPATRRCCGIGDDDDLKGATLLFASQAGKHITGQVLPIDGGVSAIIAA